MFRRQSSFQSQVELEGLSVHAYSGTPYDITESSLYFLQDSRIGPHSPGWRPLPRTITCDAAAQLLWNPLVETREAAAALSRVVDGLETYSVTPAGRGLPIKTFNDLDTLKFHGALTRRVLVRWATNVDDEVAITYAAGDYEGSQRLAILLNADYPWHTGSMLDLVGVLVHEMVHAWYMVHCGLTGSHGDDYIFVPGQDPDHGYYFWRAAECVLTRVTQYVQRREVVFAFARAFAPVE